MLRTPKYRVLNWALDAIMRGREGADYAAFHPRRTLLARAHAETVDFIAAELPDAIGFDTPQQLMDHAIKAITLPGLIVECGVDSGGSINHLAGALLNRRIHGFDSFEGLPENWSGNNLARGHFARGGRLPTVRDNVTLHRGWFDATLPPFAATLDAPLALLHIDCDLYSSTKTIFEQLAPHLAVGTVLVFDEYFNYPNWQAHEHKAFLEFTATHGITVRYLGYAYEQLAMVITATSRRLS
jgi:predicted O-methyltransferase YrrM